MKKVSYTLLVILLVYSNFYSQQIKLMQGWVHYANEPDSLLRIEKKFSKEGYLLREHAPEIYCSQEYEYDSSGRMTLKDNFCGESSANGSTVFKYSANKTYIKSSCSGYEWENTEILNEKGQVIKEISISLYMEGEHFNETTDFYYENDKLKKKVYHEERFYDTTSYEYKHYKNTDTTITRKISYYSYTEFDSLLTMFEIVQGSGDTTAWIINKYDPKTHRMIESNNCFLTVNHYLYLWEYDISGSLVKYTIKNIPHKEEEIYEYTYKSNKLNKVTITNTNQTFPSVTKKYYSGGLLRKENRFEKGKLNSTVNYYYTFW